MRNVIAAVGFILTACAAQASTVTQGSLETGMDVLVIGRTAARPLWCIWSGIVWARQMNPS